MGSSIVIACVAGVWIAGRWMVDRILPAGVTLSSRSYEDLSAEFTPWLNFSDTVFILTFGGGILGWWLCFWGLEVLASRLLPPAPFVLRPSWVFLFFPALPLGAVTTALLHERITRRWLKERYSDFWWFAMRHRSLARNPESTHHPSLEDYASERRGLVLVLPPLAAGSLLVAAMTVAASACFTPSEIVVHPFFALREHHYRYEDVASVAVPPINYEPTPRRRERRPEQRLGVIDFRDGSSFSTDDWPFLISARETRALATFVRERSSPYAGRSSVETPLTSAGTQREASSVGR